MKEFLELLIKNIVNNPKDVSIEEQTDGTIYNYKITVNPDDMGIVIGKEGRTIRSIRSLSKSKAIKDEIKINIELVEPEKPTE